MFNPLTPAELGTAMGRAARDAARNADPGSPFVRAQLLSVYSASRHLGVELSDFEPALLAFTGTVAQAARAGVAGADSELQALAAELGETRDPRRAGDLVCRLLDRVRSDASTAGVELRAAVRAALVTLVDREVELLAAVIEGGEQR